VDARLLDRYRELQRTGVLPVDHDHDHQQRATETT